MTTFEGFPRDALTFYQGLRQDNSKAYWEANKATWEAQVLAPMQALLAELDERYGPFHRFRPYRDVRFSKGESLSDSRILASHTIRKKCRRPS